MFINGNELESYYTAQLVGLHPGKKIELNIPESVILFAISGSFLLLSEDQEEAIIQRGEMVFIHAGMVSTVRALEKVQLLELRFPEILILCNRYIPEVVEQRKYECDTLFHPLSIKKYVELWLHSLHILVADLKDSHPLIKTKTKELFLLLKICYPREELVNFFCPVFSYNYDFTLFVLNNYYKVKTVLELAELSSLSLSGFEREFRKVFNSSPYRWMLRKKMTKLYDEISGTDKLFKVIAEEYGFLSLSQLGDFCRKHFGASPREIRNKRLRR